MTRVAAQSNLVRIQWDGVLERLEHFGLNLPGLPLHPSSLTPNLHCGLLPVHPLGFVAIPCSVAEFVSLQAPTSATYIKR